MQTGTYVIKPTTHVRSFYTKWELNGNWTKPNFIFHIRVSKCAVLHAVAVSKLTRLTYMVNRSYADSFLFQTAAIPEGGGGREEQLQKPVQKPMQVITH